MLFGLLVLDFGGFCIYIWLNSRGNYSRIYLSFFDRLGKYHSVFPLTQQAGEMGGGGKAAVHMYVYGNYPAQALTWHDEHQKTLYYTLFHFLACSTPIFTIVVYAYRVWELFFFESIRLSPAGSLGL